MIVLPTSPVPTIVGVLSLVSYPTLLSHPTLINHGAPGAVLSTITFTLVHALSFPSPSSEVNVKILDHSHKDHITILQLPHPSTDHVAISEPLAL